MNKNTEQGMITLLFTSLLLVALLILTLTSYRPLILQTRMANNQVAKAQSHWIAEGGVQCVYGQFKTGSQLPSTFHKCSLPKELDIEVTNLDAVTYQIQSRYRYAVVSAVIVLADGEYQWMQGGWRDF
ncbi:hypothetical protein P7F88_14940 [Vibrio hannami]|uniref:hypothetical protein n=1 Tax=Vibrio hannami TaxID=2717094 RepID=UPI00240EAA03|nr:hypothetical protein [Vibrio hannami]MDG3087303.1 hypothetical protein [Vibrio hannami]